MDERVAAQRRSVFHLTEIPDMLVDENYRLSKVKRGIEYITKYHSPEVVTKKLLEEYESAKLIG